jgi:hypothetical protein
MDLGVRSRLPSNTAGSGLGPWYLPKAKALSVGLSHAYFKSFGLRTVVWQGSAGDCRPYADQRTLCLAIFSDGVEERFYATGAEVAEHGYQDAQARPWAVFI